MKIGVKQLTVMGVLTATAMIFSYIESLFASFIPVPGVKLGLANAIILLALFTVGEWQALVIGFVRVLLSAILFGNPMSLCISACGFLLSFLFMFLLKRSGRFSIIGISLGGGAAHNFGQLICVSIYMNSFLMMRYIFLFSLFGVLTGLVTGFVCKLIYERVKLYDWLS
ncbi:MAG: Gx transporter family protein [Lachnospiraceae bacterium]|nr:Gx transporter family protein [Lachnospiraceae bacterium]